MLIFKEYPHCGTVFYKQWNSIWRIYIVLCISDGKILQPGFMKKLSNRLILFVALSIGTIVGIFKGSEAKQKWNFRIKSRFDEKRHLAELKKIQKDGGVLLDDIEIAAFHN